MLEKRVVQALQNRTNSGIVLITGVEVGDQSIKLYQKSSNTSEKTQPTSRTMFQNHIWLGGEHISPIVFKLLRSLTAIIEVIEDVNK